MKILFLILCILLVIASLFLGLVGFNVSQGAPQEAVVAGVCCFLAILARIAQAASHNCK